MHAAVGLQLAPAMEQLLVTLADVQSEDVATVADVLVDMETTSPRKKLSLTNKHGDLCGKTKSFVSFFNGDYHGVSRNMWI